MQSPGYSQTDEVADIRAVKSCRLLKISVQDICFEHLIPLYQRQLPGKGKLAGFVLIGTFQHNAASVVSLGFSFQKAPSVVGIRLKRKVPQISLNISRQEIRSIAVSIVIPEIKAAEQSAI